ncbi:zinc-binding dehydrogenase [Chloroflexota bacterium]
MKAALLKGQREVILEEVAVPEIGEDEVLVEVKYCGICGGDLHSFKDGLPFQPGTYLGHEFSGVIARVGGDVKGWKPGDRVVANPTYVCGECSACRHGRYSICVHGFEHSLGCAAGKEHAGAFARYVRVPFVNWRLHRLPDEISFEEGALIEPLACSLHAVRRSAVRPGDQVMVLGAGPMGLGVIAFLKNAGASLIIATELVQKRVELAKRFGADHVFNPQETPNLREEVLRLTAGEGVDVVFDCSGLAHVFQSATQYLKTGGQILLVGVIEKEVAIYPMDFVVYEWELKASVAHYADEFPMVIKFLQKGSLPTSEMITSKIKLSNLVKDGFEALTTPGNKEIKIIVEPDD